MFRGRAKYKKPYREPKIMSSNPLGTLDHFKKNNLLKKLQTILPI